MALPPAFDKNVPRGSAATAITGSAPALIAGGQAILFMNQLGFDGLQSAGLLAEVLAKSTLFQGRFLDDIFVLFFTQPSSLAKRVGLASSLASAAASAPIVNGARLQNVAALLPNFFAFVFRINPTVHSRTQSRVRNTVLTKGGYLTQYWSAGMKQMTFSGSSGSLVPPDVTSDTEAFNIRQTVQYANFKQLRQFYEQSNQDVGIFFLGRTMLGVMSDFSFVEDADDPYQIKYTFKFEAYPEYQELG